jgi:hypothetical protein
MALDIRQLWWEEGNVYEELGVFITRGDEMLAA